MNLLNDYVLCYILSIALQVAGALMLMINFWGDTKRKIIDTIFPDVSPLVERDENNMVDVTKGDLRRVAKDIYLNRIAFIYILSGYIIGIYSGVGNADKCCIAAKIICTTTFLIIIGHFISKIISSIIFRENLKIDYDIISNRVEAAITEAEIDALFDEVFKN